MKIEKINNNKIKCLIGKEELIQRHIKISELNYGSNAAKELFRDIMAKASDDFGFKINGEPLMIEAIPLANEEIMLIVTKVKSKEDMGNRFYDMMNLESHTFEKATKSDDFKTLSKQETIIENNFTVRFSNIDELIFASKKLDLSLINEDALFYDEKYEVYYLYIKMNEVTQSQKYFFISTVLEFIYGKIYAIDFSCLSEQYALIAQNGVLENYKNF